MGIIPERLTTTHQQPAVVVNAQLVLDACLAAGRTALGSQIDLPVKLGVAVPGHQALLPFIGWFKAHAMSSQIGADTACFRTTLLTREGGFFRRRATLE